MTDWYEVLTNERRDNRERGQVTAQMLGRLAFLLDRPGALEAIRGVLDDGTGYPNDEFGRFLVEFQAWPWGPGKVRNHDAEVPAEVAPSLGEALGRWAEAGRFVTGWPHVPAVDRDRLSRAGLIEPVAEDVPGCSYQLTGRGIAWCEHHADVETRIRAIHGRARRADARHVWLSLTDLRDALAEGDPVPWAQVVATITTMHRAGVVGLLDSATTIGDGRAHGELTVPTEDGPCDLIVAAIEVPRATPAADPLTLAAPEQERPRARLGHYARALDALPARALDALPVSVRAEPGSAATAGETR